MDDLAKTLTALWEGREDVESVMPLFDAQHAVHDAIDLLDRGEARVAELVDGEVVVNEWLKYAVLLLFRFAHMETIELGPFEYHDKIPLKRHYDQAHVRVVPGASARWGSYLAPGAMGHIRNTTTCMTGVYVIPALYATYRVPLTNTTPVAAYRGAGRPEATALATPTERLKQ